MALAEAEAGPLGATESGEPPSDGRPRSWVRRYIGDLLALLGYFLGAVVAMRHLITGNGLNLNQGDSRHQAFAEAMLLHGAHVLTQGQAPFFTDRINFPDGVNPLATHGFLGLSIPLTPLTLALGPARAFVVATIVCLVATGYAWYHVLNRRLRYGRLGAIVGGALGGLGPALVSHAQGDLSRVALFLVPFLIWRTLRLREPGRALRNGLVLGLLAAWQVLLDEEVLFLVALGWLAYLIGYWIMRRDEVRRYAPDFLRGLGVAALTCAVLVGYPLWVQFFGPQLHHGATSVAGKGADVFSFFSFATPSLATWPVGQLHYAATASEQNAFYGWPLLLFLAAAVVGVRTPRVRALTGAGCAFALLSIGNEVVLKGRHTGIPGPWLLLDWVPGLRSIPPVDLALAILPFVILVIALLVDRGQRMVAELHKERPEVPARLVWLGMLTAALLPLAPAPIHTVPAPVPRFITDGTWRAYVPDGRSLVAVPAGTPASRTLRWTVATDLRLPLAGIEMGSAVNKAAGSGKNQKVDERQRAAVLKDLRYSRVSVVVLVPQRNEEALRVTTSTLLGFYPTWVDGVWLWDLRAGGVT
jgi:hypothetical protein